MASHHEINHLVPTGSDAATGASNLGRLNDLDEFKVADGYPDIRGWDVRTTDGNTVGKVGDLIVDTSAMRVRYLDVEVDRSVSELAKDAVTPGDQERHTLLPIGNVQLDEQGDHVMVDGYTLEQIAGLPRYGGQTITRDYESTLRDRHRNRGVTGAVAGAAAATGAAVERGAEKVKDAVTGRDTSARDTGADLYNHADYDDQRLYAPRRGARDANTQRITLAEEQLAVGKQQVSAGEAELRKVVDTRHVQEQVATTREEVTVERRPITDASQLDAQPIGDDEIRIPVMEEQLVVEKRMVPVEQIIVRKRQVADQQTVEADLRKERLEVDDATARAAGLVNDAGTTAASSTTRRTDER
ncbi:hypothetical protein tb265_25670 [Gemmatimonadetes bacterium T265]|nr:hypothetical protein tb265_25670 [Gemmatimonadetes bacterium T265]